MMAVCEAVRGLECAGEEFLTVVVAGVRSARWMLEANVKSNVVVDSE